MSSNLSSSSSEKQNGPEVAYIQLVYEAMLRIQKLYVDQDKVPFQNLAYGAIQGMLKTLNDGHTTFLNAEQFAQLRESLNNAFGGLGIYIAIQDGLPTVVAPIEGTPAFFIGIKPGDKIVDIEGVSTQGMDSNQVIKRLKGAPNTKVSIKVFREEALELLPFTITRAVIQVPTIRFAFVRPGVAYIRILSFGEKTISDFKNAIQELQKDGIQKLVLDLRNNPGGLLKVSVQLVDLFLNKGKIVFTKGRQAQENEVFTSTSAKTIFPASIPMVVLVNRGSASASEIVAGALQDTRRAIIVGDKTFGKGSVQSIIPLSKSQEAIAMRLTVQKYFTPSGRSIHGKGIEPDVFVYIPKKDFDQIYMERKLYNGPWIKDFIKKYPQHTKKQLDVLIKQLKDVNVLLKPRTVEQYIRSKKSMKKKPLIFDLEYDLVLKKALEILNSHQFFKKQVKYFQ